MVAGQVGSPPLHSRFYVSKSIDQRSISGDSEGGAETSGCGSSPYNSLIWDTLSRYPVVMSFEEHFKEHRCHLCVEHTYLSQTAIRQCERGSVSIAQTLASHVSEHSVRLALPKTVIEGSRTGVSQKGKDTRQTFAILICPKNTSYLCFCLGGCRRRWRGQDF